MKHTPKKLKAKSSKLKALLAALLAGLASASPASVPLRWTVETSRVSPAVWEAYHGETLALEASLQSYGRPLAATNQEVCIYWQTNGMGAAYWSAPAWASNNVLRADFTPAMDPGAPVVNGFVGSPGDIYRASFQLRFRPSPGADSAVVTPPVRRLDFAYVEVLNPPYYTKEEADEATNALSRALSAADSALSDAIARAANDATNNTDAATNAFARTLSDSITDAASAATNYTDSSESYLRALVSRKADKYKYEEGVTSNVLVSCDWWHTGVSILLVEEEDGEDVYWSGRKSRPSPRPSLGGTVYTLTYEIGVGWIFESSLVTSADHTFVTNQQDRAAAVLDFGDFTLVRTNEVWAAGTNRCPVVYSDDLAALSDGVPGIVTNTVTKSYVESLGIESGVPSLEPATNYTDSATNELTQQIIDLKDYSDERYATTDELSSTTGLLSALADEVEAVSNMTRRVYSFMNGATNANFVVTNYQLTAETDAGRTHFDPADPDLDFSTVPASLRLEDASSGTNRVVCDTRDWTVWYFAQKIGGAMYDAYSNAVATCRAWCGFTATGLENPVPDTLVVDVPNIWLMAGKTFEKHIAGTNSMWVIRSKDMVVPISDNSSVTNFLELTDAFGTPYIRFNKTESYFIDPAADGIEYDSATGAWLISYGTQVKPKGGANAVIQGSTMYPGKAILKDEDDPDCPATITWTGSAGAWVMNAVPKSEGGVVPDKMFFAAVVEVEGQDYIEYLRPMSVPHLLINGVKIAPVVNGSTVTWQVVP